MQERVQLAIVLTILNVSASTVRRLIKEDNFPKPKKVGNQLFFRTDLIYKWLSKQAGRDITIGDKLLSSKKLEALFSRSSAWVWIHFQKNKQRKSKAIYLRSKPYWTESFVLSDPELIKYLNVLQEVA